MKVYILFSIPLPRSHIWKKSGFWDMGQNALGQSNCRIFKSALSLEQNMKWADFFACWWYKWKLKFDWKILGWTSTKMGVTTEI